MGRGGVADASADGAAGGGFSSSSSSSSSYSSSSSSSAPASAPAPAATSAKEVHDFDVVAILCGLTAGVSQAGLFNPWDRALYLSVKNRTKFLCAENFRSPYQGFLQSLGGRALSSGLYFPLEHFFMSKVPPEAGGWANFAAGTAAGSVNALLLNPLTAVKYKTWGREVNRGMLTEAIRMWEKGGIRPFLNGLVPTLWRDVIFGGVYTFLRLEAQWHGRLPPEYQWIGNFGAAAIATVASGPFNLARNVQYGTKSVSAPLTLWQVQRKLVEEVHSKSTWYEKWGHVQNRLRIGWGTARVAVGMAFGHYVYDRCVVGYRQLKERTPSAITTTIGSSGPRRHLSREDEQIIRARRRRTGLYGEEEEEEEDEDPKQ